MISNIHNSVVSPEPPTDPPMGFQGVTVPTPYQAPAYEKKPFLRMGNICVAVDRIDSVELLPEAKLYKIGDTIFYGERSAEAQALIGGEEPVSFTDNVVVVNYTNKNGMRDYVRRWGEEANDIWLYVTVYLSAP